MVSKSEIRAAKNASTVTKLRALISAMLFNLCIGSYYMYGNINSYVFEYLKHKGNDNISAQDCLIVQPIWLIMQSVWTAISIRIADKLGYRAVNWIAFGSYALVNFLCAYMDNYYFLIYFYSFMSGSSCGLGYLMGIYITWTYYPEKKGLVTGIILFTAGVSASILSPLTTYVVNPNNKEASDPEVYKNVPKMFTVLGFYFLVLTLVAGLIQPPPLETEDLKKVIKKKKNYRKLVRSGTDPKSLKEFQPEDLEFKRQLAYVNRHRLSKEMDDVLQDVALNLISGLNEDRVNDLMAPADGEFDEGNLHNVSSLVEDHDQTANDLTDGSGFNSLRKSYTISSFRKKLSVEEVYKQSQEIKEVSCPSLKFGFRSKTFLMVASMAFCSSIYNYFFNSAWKDFGITRIPDIKDDKLSLILSAASVCNSVARLTMGVLILKISFKVLYVGVLVVQIFCAFTITSFATSYYTYLMYVCLSLFCLGSHVTLFPTLCTKAFGIDVGRRIYPYIYQCFSASSLAQYFIYKYIDKREVGPLFTVFGSMSIIALVLVIMFTDEVDWSDANLKHDAEERQKAIEPEDL